MKTRPEVMLTVSVTYIQVVYPVQMQFRVWESVCYIIDLYPEHWSVYPSTNVWDSVCATSVIYIQVPGASEWYQMCINIKEIQGRGMLFYH